MSEQGSRLLIEESPLQVLPSLATAIGLNEAIVLQQIHYRQRISPNVRDGVRYVAMSVIELTGEFPFWSKATIERSIGNLREKKLLIVTRESETTWDRSNWYAVDYATLASIAENQGMHHLKMMECTTSDCGDPSPQNEAVSNVVKSNNKKEKQEGKAVDKFPPQPPTATPDGKVKCRGCGQRVSAHTQYFCNLCYRAGKHLEAAAA